jgi:hypothetical protein
VSLVVGEMQMLDGAGASPSLPALQACAMLRGCQDPSKLRCYHVRSLPKHQPRPPPPPQQPHYGTPHYATLGRYLRFPPINSPSPSGHRAAVGYTVQNPLALLGVVFLTTCTPSKARQPASSP